ncbi:WD40-repeat-containing domain protein [Pisolithus albus]|nr:WD40-repeat-containing domain protein [Pisolithus albus]
MGEYGLWWSLEGHRAPINCLTFTEDGTHIASGGDDGHVVVWVVEDGNLRRRLKPKQGPIIALKWLRDDSRDICYLMSTGANGTLVIWRFTIGSGMFEWLHMETVFDTAIEEARPVPNTEEKCNDPSSGPIPPVAFTSTPTFSSNIGSLHPASPQRHSGLPGFTRALLRTRIGSTAYHEGSKTLLVWNLIDGIDVYQLMDCSLYSLKFVRHLQIQIRRNRICHVQFDLDGKRAITGSDNGQVLIWDVNSGQLVQALRHGQELHAVQVVRYHSSQFNKHFVASGSSDSAGGKVLLRLWSTEGIVSRADDGESLPAKATVKSGPLHLRCLIDFFLVVVISILLTAVIHYYYA